MFHPELKLVPMAVAGLPEQRHGIVLAKNELARSFGVKTAETVNSALRKCPQLVLVRPHRKIYLDYSERVNQIYLQYTDQVEPFGIDESWLDVTGSVSLFGNGVSIADKIRNQVRQELGISVSVGVSFNKVFAKLGSDYKKPDATTLISRGKMQQIVWPLPVDRLLGVGRNTFSQLSILGIHTIGQLATADPSILQKYLGKPGKQLFSYARGDDDSPVRKWDEPENVKSVGNGQTFDHDLISETEIRARLLELADIVAFRLRKCNRKCRTLHLTVKSPSFSVIQRQIPLPFPTYFAADLAECALRLLRKHWAKDVPIRALTLTASSLIAPEDIPVQFRLDTDPEDQLEVRKERMAAALDGLWEKYGRKIISYGSLMQNELNASENQ